MNALFQQLMFFLKMALVLPVLQGCLQQKESEFQKIVWLFWHSGADTMHDLLKQNVRQMEIMLGKDWELHVLSLNKDDPEYIGKYLDIKADLPEYFLNVGERIYVENGRPASSEPVVQSDILRLALLRKYGGVWMDPSILVTRDLVQTSLFNNFQKNDIEVAGYFVESHVSSKFSNKAFGLDNWFIMAKKNSEVIKKWEETFWEYWRKMNKDTSIYQHPDYQSEDPALLSNLENPNYLNQHAAWRKFLYNNRNLAKKVYVESAEFGKSPENPGPFVYWTYYGLEQKDFYRAFTGQPSNKGELKNLDDIAKKFAKANCLKFPSYTLVRIKQEFKTLEDFYGPRDNLFRRLWHRSLKPKIGK